VSSAAQRRLVARHVLVPCSARNAVSRTARQREVPTIRRKQARHANDGRAISRRPRRPGRSRRHASSTGSHATQPHPPRATTPRLRLRNCAPGTVYQTRTGKTQVQEQALPTRAGRQKLDSRPKRTSARRVRAIPIGISPGKITVFTDGDPRALRNPRPSQIMRRATVSQIGGGAMAPPTAAARCNSHGVRAFRLGRRTR
jgi:hypothetical protein